MRSLHRGTRCAFAGLRRAARADQKLLAAARAAQPAVIDSLREMVLIESGSQDAAGLKAHGRLPGRPAARAGRDDRAHQGRHRARRDGQGHLHRQRQAQLHAHRPHGHGLCQGHPGQRAVPAGRQQALRPGHRRRQGRHRRDPAFAGHPARRRLEGLRAADGADQPRRGDRLQRLGRDHRRTRRRTRRGAVLRAHRGQGRGQGRGRAADGAPARPRCAWPSRAAPRMPARRPTRAATR